MENGRRVKLQIWDTAGQERFRGLARQYYKGVDAVVLVYDVTEAKTFVGVMTWLDELAKFASEQKEIFQILVGNKVSMCLFLNANTKIGIN